MIYTITLNPALDYIIGVPDYTDGAVNRTASEKLLAGGKGINVSAVLHNLGVESTALGFLAGFTGQMLEKMLDEIGVEHDFVYLDSGFTRINVKIKTETEINGRGPEITSEKINEILKITDKIKKGDILVLAGSVPKSVPDNIYCEIMERVCVRGADVIVDAEGTLLTDTLKFRPFLIKPNNHELGAMFGRQLTTADEITECAKKLQETGARNVLVSMGGDGAVMLCEDGNILKSDAPKGRVINSTGAGDSMVAGFIAGFIRKKDYRTAFYYGLAAGSASAFSENLASYEEVKAVLKSIGIND